MCSQNGHRVGSVKQYHKSVRSEMNTEIQIQKIKSTCSITANIVMWASQSILIDPWWWEVVMQYWLSFIHYSEQK